MFRKKKKNKTIPTIHIRTTEI